MNNNIINAFDVYRTDDMGERLLGKEVAFSLSIQSCHTIASMDIQEFRRRQSINNIASQTRAHNYDDSRNWSIDIGSHQKPVL